MNRHDPVDVPEMSVREVVERYRNEWVLMVITPNAAANFMSTVGRVLCHAPDRKRAAQARARQIRLRSAGADGSSLLLFEAVQPIESGAELRSALREALAHPAVQERGIEGAWRPW